MRAAPMGCAGARGVRKAQAQRARRAPALRAREARPRSAAGATRRRQPLPALRAREARRSAAGATRRRQQRGVGGAGSRAGPLGSALARHARRGTFFSPFRFIFAQFTPKAGRPPLRPRAAARHRGPGLGLGADSSACASTVPAAAGAMCTSAERGDGRQSSRHDRSQRCQRRGPRGTRSAYCFTRERSAAPRAPRTSPVMGKGVRRRRTMS